MDLNQGITRLEGEPDDYIVRRERIGGVVAAEEKRRRKAPEWDSKRSNRPSFPALDASRRASLLPLFPRIFGFYAIE